MVGVPMHEPASFSCPDPKLFDAQIRKFEAIKHRVMREEGLVPRKALQMRRRARYSSYAGERGERPANLPLREDGTHDFRAAAPNELWVVFGQVKVSEMVKGAFRFGKRKFSEMVRPTGRAPTPAPPTVRTSYR